ncbi:MAG: rhomboid family serine protease [Verrucomicrobiales bacterium]|nr:rhomboid family serine protease [Verrucomicrobiales bacterium]
MSEDLAPDLGSRNIPTGLTPSAGPGQVPQPTEDLSGKGFPPTSGALTGPVSAQPAGGAADEGDPDRLKAAERPGLIPVCPRCHVNLLPAKHATGIAWRCSKCEGQSLNFSQFRRMIPNLNANEIWLTAMEQPVAPRRRSFCPECRRDMAAVLIPWEGREIELDVCRTCQRLWMENQENLRYKLESTQESPGPKPPVIRMKGRGLDRMLAEQLRRIRSDADGPRRFDANRWLWVPIALWVLFELLRMWNRKP